MWGYQLLSLDALPDLITAVDFRTFSGGEYDGQEERIQAEITAAGAAVRGYCGWHLYPEASCEAEMTMQDRRITVVGRDLLVQLPAKFVTAVSAVSLAGTALEHTFEPNGILRCYDVNLCGVKRWHKLTVTYTAGLPEAMMDPIKELIAHRVKHALAVPSGITSEASGGVSVTYNAAWINSAQSTTMQDANKELLAPYTLRGVF